MIVVDEPDGSLLLVRQPHHAAMSAQIAAAWRRPAALSPGVWQRLLEAVRVHDDGWWPFEDRPELDPHGRPVDFKSIPTPRHVVVWDRSIERAASADRYVALLVALHARWLYTHVGQDGIEDQACAQEFVRKLNERIDMMIEALGRGTDEQRDAATPTALALARRLVSFFDAVSLCLIGTIDWIDRSEALGFEGRETVLRLERPHKSADVAITPWPFAPDRLTTRVRAVRLPRQRFADPSALAAAMSRADPIDLEWTLGPEASPQP